MQFDTYPEYESMSRAASAFILEHLQQPQHIGLSTGFSPLRTYEMIGHKLRVESIQSANIFGFQLDEWLGMGIADDGSCSHYISENIIRSWEIRREQVFLIDGATDNPGSQVEAMRKQLKHRLDICILGLGRNGHLALNEPGSRAGDGCRIVDLAESSQSHQMLDQTQLEVKQGITIGLEEILQSKQILLLITGEGKREAYQKLCENEPTESFPASVL